MGGEGGAGADVGVEVVAAEAPGDDDEEGAGRDDLGDGAEALALLGDRAAEAVAGEVEVARDEEAEEDDRGFGGPGHAGDRSRGKPRSDAMRVSWNEGCAELSQSARRL